MTISKLEDLKQDLDEPDEETAELKSQIQHINDDSHNVDELRGTCVQKSQEADDLKCELEVSPRRSIEIENEKSELSDAIQSLELQLTHSANERSMLQGSVDHALMIVQVHKAKVKWLKGENAELQSSFSETRRLLEESQSALTELRSMSGNSDLESSYLRQQLSIAQAESECNMSLLEAMQVTLDTASADLQQKMMSILELIKGDRRKAKEIDVLQSKLTAMQTKTNQSTLDWT
jgi:chromosome segregation ATPase